MSFKSEEETRFKNSWRKNLYSNVGYKDNYTDVTFLAQLRTNIHPHHVTFKEAFLGSVRVTQQLCILSIFVVLYLYLEAGILEPNSVFLLSSAVTSLCYLIYYKSIPASTQRSLLGAHGKTVVIFFILGHILSPVLKTLTDTISTDTINATTLSMMLVHVVFFDYKVPVAIVSSALSTNAALFGSLCLASRLPSSYHAFVLLTVSVECFVLYPPFSYLVYHHLSLAYFLTLFLITCCSLASVSAHMLILFLIVVAFVNILCPALYVRWQKYKNNIYGPWDEAVIKDKSTE